MDFLIAGGEESHPPRTQQKQPSNDIVLEKVIIISIRFKYPPMKNHPFILNLQLKIKNTKEQTVHAF
jgi:hypothetical protein